MLVVATSQKGANGRTVGRYVLYDEIASGGMASVHLGKLCGPVGFSPIVAIKALHPPFAKDPDFVKMFLDEARLAARIRHPNVVPVIDVHAEEGELFLVLEYVHGESLARLIQAARRDRQPIPASIASAVLCDALHGLHAAHEAMGERGEPLAIVHRDVSPQNVLVGTDGVARVFDFGIAKATGRMQTTYDGQVKGKFAYMAPEQLRGENVNRQADLYAAAVVLWEALVGERLFRAENEGNTVERVLFAPVPPPSSLRPDVSHALDAVVVRGLARERSQRFGTAKEMALALESAVARASGPQVGEWVEARAVEALEARARLVARVKASNTPGVSSADKVAKLMAYAQSPGTAPQASSASGASSSRDRATNPLPTPAGDSASSRAALLAVALVVVAAGALGFALRVRRAPAAVGVPAGGEVDPGATFAVAASEEHAGGASTGPGSNVARASPPAEHGHWSKPWSAIKRKPSAAPASPRPSSTARCSRRNAEGAIEFDTECLRAAQHAP
jgi:serine/threonine protein kinase